MKEDIIRMAREVCGEDQDPFVSGLVTMDHNELARFAALVAAAERNKLAQWMIAKGYATGHGDTVEDLLQELEWQIAENWTRWMVNGVQAEREACAKLVEPSNEHRRDASWGTSGARKASRCLME